jgi:hypothetical protein
MKIRAGYNIAFTMSLPTPMLLMLSVHPSRTKDLLTNPRILTEPHLPLREYRDMFGNICTQVTAGPGQVRFSSTFDILAIHKSCLISPGKPLAIPKPGGTWSRRFAILFTTTLNLDIRKR